MKNKSKIAGAVLTAALMLGCVGCGGCAPKDEEIYKPDSYTPVHGSADRLITFSSSDSTLDAFLNEYRERHMRYSENRIHTHPVGAGSTAWKEWESMVGSWWDASADYGTMDSFYATKDLVTDWLLAPKQDNQGYVWVDDGAALGSWGMGWEFPNATKDGGVVYDFTNDEQGYTASGSGVTSWWESSRFNVRAESASELTVTSPQIEINPLTAPFMKLNFYYVGNGSDRIEDIYLYYKTQNDSDWSEERRVSFSEDCTTGFQIGSSSVLEGGYFFPMYLSEDWGWGDSRPYITQIKLVVKGESTFSGTLSIDYISTDFDDRHAINPCNYIIAAKNVCEYAQDASLLEHMLPYARKAMNFLCNQLQGSEGLISTEYFMGHDNTGLKAFGTGIGNGYWDVLAFPDVNLYTNLSYYNALVAMTYLENMADYYGIDVGTVTTVNGDMNGTDTYSLDADSLAELTETCLSRFRSEFWNERTGRFHAGTRSDGTVQDNGYLMFNQQAIAAGIPTEQQTESIMSWINGERTVAGDRSQGEDIYRYEFAPRFNTVDISTDFYWGYSASFNGNVQNGGTALHLAYYDLVAQSAVSTQNAYSRLKTIQTWFEKVKAAGGEGWNFYRAYYDKLQIGVQGGGSSGVIGLDYEFLEAALLISAIPDAFFGMSANYDNTLVFQPNMPEQLDYWKMENVTYAGNYCDVAIGRYFIQLSDVTEIALGTAKSGSKAEFRLREPGFAYKVCIDGAETDQYTVENGRIVVRTELKNVRVEVMPA